ncbi:MAG TPA: hypothetical protein VF303_00305 [Candidatus Nanoarchaeia archaeon]
MSQKIDLIRQALSAAESSIKLARQLLFDIEKDGVISKPKAKELPGVVGIFDGQSVVTERGEKFPVPENYASKSILVVGDSLKLVDQGGAKRFKQVEHVKRHKSSGILAKKDGKWTAVTSEGSYRLLPAAVEHYEGSVGDEVLVQLPANNLQTPWAAVEKITKKGGEEAKVGKEDKEAKQKKEKEPQEKVKEIKEEKEKARTEEKEKVKEEPEVKEKSEPTPESTTEVAAAEPKQPPQESAEDELT